MFHPVLPFAVKWRQKCLPVGPSIGPSLLEDAIPEADDFSPLAHRLRVLAKRHFDGVLFVATLLLSIRPTAVFWAVIAIHVDAVNRVVKRRTISHVSVERFIAIEPSIANSNAPAAIPVVLLVHRIPAPVDHFCPDAKLCADTINAGVTMLCVGGRNELLPAAPATSCFSTPDITTVENLVSSAVALKEPVGSPDIIHGCQAAVPLSRNINNSSANGLAHGSIIATFPRQEDPWRWN